MEARLIIDGPKGASENMALDYALHKNLKRPVLRIYQWKPRAVSIGCFQGMEDEVDIGYCKENNIGFVRRITGGGAVFHDSELTYSFILPVKNDLFAEDVEESYREICAAIIKAIEILGIRAEFSPLNDIIAGGKKISGCAQTRKDRKILHHGTLLLDVDVETMFNALKVPDEKMRDKLIKDARQRVTSIGVLCPSIDIGNVADAVVEGFSRHFGISFLKSHYTRQEIEDSKRFQEKIFQSRGWNFRR